MPFALPECEIYQYLILLNTGNAELKVISLTPHSQVSFTLSLWTTNYAKKIEELRMFHPFPTLCCIFSAHYNPTSALVMHPLCVVCAALCPGEF